MLASSVARFLGRSLPIKRWAHIAQQGDTLLEVVFPWREPLGTLTPASGFTTLPLASAPAQWVFPTLPFGNPSVRRLVHALKFGASWEAAVQGGWILARRQWDRLRRFPKPIWIVPVPLSPARKRERGFNQSTRLAFWFLVALWDIDPQLTPSFSLCSSLLLKTRHTLQQSHLRDHTLRIANVQGAFQARMRCPAPPPTILLIDDVVTTGATLRECRRALVRAGFRRIRALTLAG